MRLDILESGHSPFQKTVMKLIASSSEGQVPGPIRVMSYRRKLVGKDLSGCFQEAMRKATAWTVGEVEIFAAFVSKLNQCAY